MTDETVIPFRPAKARAPYKLELFHEIEPSLGDASDFVEQLLGAAGMSVLYGPSNTGKTFAALDLALHVAMGEPWFGREVDQGGAVYVALEGGQGFNNRIASARQHFGLEGREIPFAAIKSTVNLLSADADVPALIAAIRAAAEPFYPYLVRLVVIDTLARAMAGANENAGEDMGALVSACDKIRAETGAHIMLIHHSGKDTAKGARGHSSLRAATDTELEVDRTEDGRGVITVTKQRDYESGAAFAFRLERVELGIDRRGKPVTSCVVQPEDAASGKPKKRPKLTAEHQYALDRLHHLAAVGGPETVALGSATRVNLDSLRRDLQRNEIVENCNGEALSSTARSQWSRIKKSLVSKGYIRVEGDYAWAI